MTPIQACTLPDGALLARYQKDGAYADCYFTDIALPVTQARYVEAFYTSAVFKLERVLLAWLVSRPSTDAQARELADGTRHSFAAWSVEARKDNQLLLCDYLARTRSWLMSAPAADSSTTRLYFGSAVVPHTGRRTGQARMGLVFRVLLGFHRLYSRILLRAVVSRLHVLGTYARDT